MAMNKLDEAASLSGGDLDVGDFTKALEERAKFVLGNIARQASNEDRGVVRVGKLVHRHWVEATAALLEAVVWLLLGHPLVVHAARRLHAALGRHHGRVAKVLELTTLVTS